MTEKQETISRAIVKWGDDGRVHEYCPDCGADVRDGKYMGGYDWLYVSCIVSL